MTWSVDGFHETRELGHGASGRVVLATHDATASNVAIKYLADELRRDPAFVGTFRGEARLLIEVDDVHIARLFEYIEGPAGMAIVMELVNGVPLTAVLADAGELTPEAALYVMAGSLAALAHAHALGIVHRDYKPANVMVTTDGESKLIDFGIAAHRGQLIDAAGTPAYMAPEQWDGQAAGPAADIYAATATLFESLTGRPPFVAPDLTALRLQHLHAPAPFADAPAPTQELIKHGLAKRADRRPATAQLFLDELTAAAIEGYGADWEEKGRAALVRRVAALAALLPFGPSALDGSAVASTRLGRALAIAGIVAAIGLLSGGALAAAGPIGSHSSSATSPITTVVGGGPSTGVTSSPASAPPSAPESAPATAPASAPATTVPTVSPSASVSAPVPTLSPTVPTRPPVHRVPVPTPTPVPTLPGPTTTTASPTAIPTTAPPPTVTPTTATPAPPPVVTKLEITSFAWGEGGTGPDASATLYVATSGTGPIQLFLHYSNGVDLARNAAPQNLSGATSYNPSDAENFSGVCGTVTLTASTSAGGSASASLPSVPC
jgi:eukaryotic-like serine/threonine-protein kinase